MGHRHHYLRKQQAVPKTQGRTAKVEDLLSNYMFDGSTHQGAITGIGKWSSEVLEPWSQSSLEKTQLENNVQKSIGRKEKENAEKSPEVSKNIGPTSV